MKRFTMYFLIAFFMLPCGIAEADAWYQLVIYKCDKKNDYVMVEFKGAYNEEGEAMIKEKTADMWDPWSLVSPDKSGQHIGKRQTIKKICTLSDGKYTVEIGPSPGNTDTLGECGAQMNAWTRIKREGKQIIHQKMGSCSTKDKIVNKIVIKAGQREPLISSMDWFDFYK